MVDTIFALASAPGKSGVAVIRLSGINVPAVLSSLGIPEIEARRASLRVLRDGTGQLLDQALVIRFDAGASFTGEASAELQVHGSIAVVDAVLRYLGSTGLTRMAEPGEFTRRALLNDRLDLTEVQGLADIIEAETEVQRQEAMRVLSGEMSARIGAWRRDLIRAMALLEATIDFADEEVPEDVEPEVRTLLTALRAGLQAEVAGVGAARSLRHGFEVALIGAPNAGKSSLLNYIAKSDVSIVSPIAGTTRDVLERQFDLGGLKVIFLDTAGLRETTDEIESIGVQRAVARAKDADLRVFLQEDAGHEGFQVDAQVGDVFVRTKVDLTGGDGISTVTGQGIPKLLEEIRGTLLERVQTAGLVSRERDAMALSTSMDRLDRVLDDLGCVPDEILVEELRLTATSLQTIVGGVDIEAILDEIFSSFCLGK